jgi:bifunctional non-homologous end joining protein LigD
MLIERMRKRLAADRASFIEPCLPSPADKPPSGADWIHEIKHDGFRLMARRDPVGIRLITRGDHDWAARYPLVVEAVNHLKVRSCLIDGEVVCCDEKGVAAFQLVRHRRNEPRAFLYAFALLVLDGRDLRREAIEVRKATLASILRKSRPGVRLNEHLQHPEGAVVFQHACKMGLEGIVSKRLGSRYRSGRSRTGSSSRIRQHRRSAVRWRRTGTERLMMRADQRRSRHRTIVTAAVLLLSASAVAAQTTYYGAGGDYLGQGTWRRNTVTFYDAKANFVGSSVTSPGRLTNFFGRDGLFQGTFEPHGRQHELL